MHFSCIPRVILTAAVIVGLTSCTPADVEYCNQYGVYAGDNEFPKCMSYYHQQENAFMADASVCSAQADQIYPPTLYDYGHSGLVRSYDPYRGFSHIEHVDVPPDYYHNAQVDQLRMRIIGPCMDSHGWNSPTTWQAGRHPVKAASVKPATSTADLPWLKASAIRSTPANADLPWLAK